MNNCLRRLLQCYRYLGEQEHDTVDAPTIGPKPTDSTETPMSPNHRDGKPEFVQ